MPSIHFDILIHRYLTGAIDGSEKKQLEDWLDGDPNNRREFDEIKLLWDASQEDQSSDISDADLDKDLKLLERSIEQSRETQSLYSRTRKRTKYLSAAAVLLLLLSAGLTAMSVARRTPLERFRIETSSNDVLVLSDSSTVVLNQSSILSVSMDTGQRETRLKGEGYFEVRRDERPFTVHAGDATVRVLGTSFFVSAQPDLPVEVYVVSGTVSVEHQGSRAVALAGEKVTVEANGGLRKRTIDDPNFNSWYTRQFVFNKTELGDILDRIGKDYDASFKVADTTILRCRFTGKFHHASLEEVIRILSYTLQVEFKREGTNNYLVSGKRCRKS